MREIMHPRLGEPLPDAAPELDPVDEEELEEGGGAGEREDGEDNGVRGGVAMVRLEGDALRARLHKGQFAFAGKGVRPPDPSPYWCVHVATSISLPHTSTALSALDLESRGMCASCRHSLPNLGDGKRASASISKCLGGSKLRACSAHAGRGADAGRSGGGGGGGGGVVQVEGGGDVSAGAAEPFTILAAADVDSEGVVKYTGASQHHTSMALPPELVKILPPDDYAATGERSYRTCAVVGNSGTMLHSQMGAEVR
jgi:hypothetical protein